MVSVAEEFHTTGQNVGKNTPLLYDFTEFSWPVSSGR